MTVFGLVAVAGKATPRGVDLQLESVEYAAHERDLHA